MFEGIKNISEIFSKIGDIKNQSAEMQKRLEHINVTADAGAGMVTVVANAKGTIQDIKINKLLFEGDDIKMMEDLIIAAANEALRKAKEAVEYEFKKSIGISPEDMMSMLNAKGGTGPV
ncbi:YbaB/EbfC family nucleoid-associated protein [Leptospira sp. GIMC2001]|uniref:YbaB/EbfC family nucleoid-associated protein n=1 Tax=Leptospira sp. GIMC2001 TaxID=1513297 RepID=UPI00234A6EAB|nr:YbaB/EbfC family nucleoid-associated protein [Leptospira sp. GIMC2001]WCL49504.1 YbaB/EbfC family nucleoid-associated protein [Leptospira sp. GIMC2001]